MNLIFIPPDYFSLYLYNYHSECISNRFTNFMNFHRQVTYTRRHIKTANGKLLFQQMIPLRISLFASNKRRCETEVLLFFAFLENNGISEKQSLSRANIAIKCNCAENYNNLIIAS